MARISYISFKTSIQMLKNNDMIVRLSKYMYMLKTIPVLKIYLLLTRSGEGFSCLCAVALPARWRFQECFDIVDCVE
jgi:hypothetical protein